MAATEVLPGRGSGDGCVVVSWGPVAAPGAGGCDASSDGGAESFWRLRGESIGNSSRGLELAMLGKRG